MFIPKIRFREMTLEENIEIIKWTFFEDNGSLSVHEFLLDYFPGLEVIDPDMPTNEIYKVIEKVVTDDYNKYKERIKEEVKRYSLLWDDYNDKYFEALSSYLGVEWPSYFPTISATVGLIPVFPRHLDDFSFSVATGIKDLKLIEVCAHETLHFLWFEKWKQLYPETPRREYDSPYLPWKYSEMVTDPVLNNKPFTDMFEFTEHSYNSFYELEDDNGDNVMETLRNIYKDDKPIDEKINNGYRYVTSLLTKDDKNKQK